MTHATQPPLAALAVPGHQAAGLRRRLQPRAVAPRGLGTRTSGSCARPGSTSSPWPSSPGPGSSPREDTWDFAWLDEIMDLLHANGIAVDLATATASPPPWLAAEHPEILPVTQQRRDPLAGRPAALAAHLAGLPRARAAPGARPWPSATRTTPPLAAWHVSNELGCHNIYDYSDDAAAAFRDWLQRPLRHPRGAQPRLGDRRSGPSATATGTQILPPRHGRLLPEPHAAAGLQALLLGRAAGLPARRTRHPATASPRTSPSPPTSW